MSCENTSDIIIQFHFFLFVSIYVREKNTYSVISGVMLVVNLIGFPIGTAKYPSLVMPPPRESRKSGESISICNSLSITNVSATNELIEEGEKSK